MFNRLVAGSMWPCAGIIAMVLATASTIEAQSGGWTVRDLGTLGGRAGEAYDINDAGHVVGASTPPGGGTHAFLWTPAGGMRDLGVLGGLGSSANAINNLGQVVGSTSQASGPGVAFLWTAAGGMVSLGSLGGFSSAEDINDAGHVVGGSVASRAYAFLWTPSGGMIDLGTLGGSNSGASAINEAGQVVGYSTTQRGDTHAFLWTAGRGMVDLGTLGGTFSEATDINEAGQVVGRSTVSGDRTSGEWHAFLWTAAGGMVDLGTLGGTGRSVAHGINDAGQVVGRTLRDGYIHAFHWTAAGGMVPLPAITGIESAAAAINNAGVAAGYGDIANSDPHAVVWTSAVAPPAPTGLVAFSVVGNAVTLGWTIASGGVAPTGFVLEGGLNPGEVLASVPTGSNSLTYTFTAPSGSFYVRMHAVNGTARSAASNEIRIHVNVPVVPSAPANLLGLVNGSSLALAWTNTYTGGAPTSLVLDVTGSIVTSVPLGLSDSFAFAGVPDGTYTLALRAQNGSGSSAASNAVTLTFPGPCSGPPQTPAHVRAYRVGNTVFVDWAPASAGPAPTGYVLGVTGSYVGAFTTSGRTISGTVGPGSYTLTVAATNACGTSAASSPQTVIVP